MHPSPLIPLVPTWLALALAAALSACSSTPDTPPENITLAAEKTPPTDASVASGPPPVPAEAPARVRLQDLCLAGQDCPTGYGAYGYLVLSGRPGGAPRDPARDAAVCEAFVKPRPPSTVTTQAPPAAVMATIWFAERAVPLTLCDELLKAYDHTRAQQLARSVARWAGTGPLLIAAARPLATGPAARERTLVLDLSRVRTTDLDRALGLWFDRLAQDQKHWKSGFAIGPLRTEFRSLLDAYGAQILRVSGPMKP